MKWKKKCFEIHTKDHWNYANPFGLYQFILLPMRIHTIALNVVTWWQSRSQNKIYIDCITVWSAMSTNVHTYWIVVKCTKQQPMQAINSIGKCRENIHQSSIFSPFPIYSFQFDMNEWVKKSELNLCKYLNE